VGWLFAYLWGSSISGLSCCCQGLALGYLSGSLWARPWGYFSGPYVRVPCEYYLGDSLWVVTSISYSGAAYSLLVIILSCRLFVDSYTGIYFSTTKSRRNPHHFVPTTLLFRGLLVSSCCYSRFLISCLPQQLLTDAISHTLIDAWALTPPRTHIYCNTATSNQILSC
jgi:hypothetical protein